MTNTITIIINGNLQINTGDIIDITYTSPETSVEFSLYQYAGFWLIYRIKHTIDKQFTTKLILIRAGVNTSADVSLKPVKLTKEL